jgi:phenylpropionate dioxygenase-like ring-hydroxylating dioxygenase large terminal subunit
MAQASGPEPDAELRATVWVRGVPAAEVGRAVRVHRFAHGGRTWTVLLWRTRRGRPVAIDARCPHRQYLMVDARLVRDSVECPIHGYRFGVDGRCVNFRHTPAARLIEVREVDGYLWLAP